MSRKYQDLSSGASSQQIDQAEDPKTLALPGDLLDVLLPVVEANATTAQADVC
jgi:hypothetical protein